EGATLQVRVAGVEPVQGPGMQGEFRSLFTVRRPLTRLRGQVVDEQREPLSGVRVEVEGQGLYTRTGADGNWALFGVQPGRVVLRYEGGSSAEGRAYPTVRRRFAVEAERDNEESTVMLTAVDAESAEPVDTSRPLHLTFGGRHGALEVDIPAGGLTFEGGSARGLVTATELPLHALPVPVEGSLRPAAVWQLQPAGTRLLQPVELRLPNRLPRLPGNQAVLFTYDPDEHVLRAAGLANFSEDGTRLVSEGAFEAGSLEYFGYLPLPEEASPALAGASGTHLGPLPQQQSFGLGSVFFGHLFAPIFGPILVRGTVRGPREQAVAIEISQPTLGVEQRVTVDERGQYRMPLSAQARSLIPPPSSGSAPEPLVITLEGTGASGQRLGPPSGTSWRQESPQGQQVELSTEVELSLGTSTLLIAGTTLSGRKVERLTAELSLADAGVPDGGPIPALLRVQRMDTGSSGTVEETNGLVRFSGLPVRVSTGWGDGLAITRPEGQYTALALAVHAYWLPGPFAVACVPLPIGYRVSSWVESDGRVQTRKTLSYVEECSAVGDGMGGDAVMADVTIDVRWLHGTVTLVDRSGQPLPAACSPSLERDGDEVVGLSQDDVRSTEVHFFREDDPSTPLVSYTVVHPESCEGSPTRPHGRYAKVRYGPASTLGRMQASRHNGQRLLPGDRMVVFAINHATGYSGMEVVTIPSVNRSSRAPDGSCPLDDAAGGPVPVRDGGRTVLISHCTLQDLGITANLKLYPPELDIRVDRRARAEGVSRGDMEPSLIRHHGAATTRDDFVRVATHWRVRRQPAQEWDAGVLEPADPSCDGGVTRDGGFCAPQPLYDVGQRGKLLERYCSELPEPRTAEQQALCLRNDSELMDVPAGVPPLAGRVVRITGSAVEEPAVASFPIRPGSSSATVQTAMRRRDQNGREVVLNNLPRANYYVQVVGHPVLPRDRNQNGTIDPAEENAPPPDFTDGEDVPGLPERALALKNVYRSLEPQGRMERYDRAREHEFSVLEVSQAQVTARTDDGRERPLPTSGQSPSAPAASPEDVAYQFLLHLLAPQDPGRTGTLSGKYALRLGTDSFGIECPIELDEQAGTLRGTCEGEYLPEVLSAGDVLYLELYLKGNAENVLYRFNFDGLSMREDYLGVASKFTAERAVEKKADGKAVEDRPISQLNEAHFFLGPQEFSKGSIRLCTNQDCSGADAIIKAATLQWSGAGSKYQVDELAVGTATTSLFQDDKPGAGDARHLRMGLPSMLTLMPGANAAAEPAEIFLVKDIELPRSSRKVERLGKPKGRFQGLNAQAPGQQSLAGINVADLHLAFTHTDFSVPHFAEAVAFSRTYANQNDLPSTLGVGWRHSLDGFVHEEQLGRYVASLGNQSWGFIHCTTVDKQAQTASGCMTDKTHGMQLEVTSGGVKLTTEQGRVYRFDQPAVKRDQKGRRKWLLTKFHDGHGRGEEDGWTHFTYAPNSNRLTKVERKPGHLSLEFKYCEDFNREDCEGVSRDAPGLLKFLARSEDFKLLKGVILKSGQQELHVMRFQHDKWGNLLEAERTTDTSAQKWKYTYEEVPDEVEPGKAWRAVNELSEARFEVAGQAQWVAAYERGGAECYSHLEPFECVSSVEQTGFMGNPFKVEGQLGNRSLSLPTGTSAQVALNDYGNVTSSTVQGQGARELTWPSSTRGGEVRLEKSVSPGGRVMEYGADAMLRLDKVKVGNASDVVGIGTGELVTVLARDALGLPTSGQLATANGPAAWSMTRAASGDVKKLIVGGTELFSRDSDDEGRITSETDALGNTTTYTFGKLGLPVTAQVTSKAAGGGGLGSYTLTMEYDNYGRLTRRFNGATGAEESWRYDSQGNVLEYTRAGQPSEKWTYAYTYGDQQLTVVERLQDVSYTRTAVFQEGLLKSEVLNYGTG
ncbi:MAG TPA: carboxypeptidase regulatory-like domain-containing protein, partial [Myxococcaceae bacterium]